MITHMVFILFLLFSAGVFSLIEIQAEGANGWAANFPTWRLDNNLTKRFMNGKPLTGYHLYFFIFMMMMVHLPYGLGFARPSLAGELRIIAYLILFFIVEDFLWFVFNPAFGLKKFKAEYIWWHAPDWWWIMPSGYWIFVPVGSVLYVLSYVL